MKKVIIIRHAKSSWKYNVDDMHRPLRAIGVRNTIKICERFKEVSEISLKNVFSSPAKRALDTCRIFVENYNSDDKIEIDVVDELYDFEGAKLHHFIKSIHDNLDTIFVFGHNNALTSFVNKYANVYVLNVPTSGLVILEFDIDKWADLRPGILKLKLFPKEIN
ncbi:phosphoglycerate mutase family protein [Formosa sp. PL04]|uniref:SixA phosphatase family protein n=1 Tax=Formosa sp. PL04 TaxID=3081755 RepID=UPI002980FBDF|nr:phosphoglycerate mutase family protein [Formosa sp. PL04]MDW5289382.1 phosphoglycerate mutase family protein [Formosa sp. PL04]